MNLPVLVGALSQPDAFGAMLDSLADGVSPVDRRRTIMFCNRASEQISGRTASDVVGYRCYENILRHVDEDEVRLCFGLCPLAKTMRDGFPCRADLWLHHKAGQRVPVSMRTVPIRDTDEQIIGAIELFTDNSVLTATEAQVTKLEALAVTDPLTGLPNRRHLELALSSRLAEQRQLNRTLGVLFADIDHFKAVNDTHGHEIGDQTLKMVATTLTSNLRAGDSATRFGGAFMRELRAVPDVADTRVVWCTATYDEQDMRRVAETCGVSHILVKPCEPEAIVHTIDMALRANGNGPHPTMSDEFDREHLRIVNAKLSQKLDPLETARWQAEQLHEDLRRANLKTAESLTLLQTLQATSQVGLGFVDRTFRVQQMNAELAVVNGLPADEQIGRTVAELVPERWPTLEPRYRHVLETGEDVVNQEVHNKDPNTAGQFRHWLSSYYPVRLNDEVIGIGLVVVDITDHQQAEEFRAVVMENLAEGLLVSDGEDRLMFMSAAASPMLGWSEYELRGQSMHDVIHYQHDDGSPSAETDCTLCEVRSEGRIVREATEAFTSRGGTIFPVSYSAGPLYGGDDVRGVVVAFGDTTNEQAERTRATRELDALTWVGRIREALDDDRLVLYSQPIISLSGHAERREECLVRMTGPIGDLIPPCCFLPAAKKYGQIGEIDQWVITQAARLASAGSHVHANLSASSIGSLDLLPRIRRALNDAGGDPASLVFEITETALMGDMEAGAAFTRGIADVGCRVALDDFGTGYGSLTYLQRFSIKYLKIDVYSCVTWW